MDVRANEFGAADAKSRFSELLARAEAGETIVIRRHGRPVAKLVPATKQPSCPQERLKAWEEWEAYRDSHDITLGPDLTVKQLIEEGRRY
ncbi:MAG TPA: type II toxin-antitoxin system prevent-host-death family antitoxin [Allosphingosinicella sp.]|jgi:prevent-host-death family protein